MADVSAENSTNNGFDDGDESFSILCASLDLKKPFCDELAQADFMLGKLKHVQTKLEEMCYDYVKELENVAKSHEEEKNNLMGEIQLHIADLQSELAKRSNQVQNMKTGMLAQKTCNDEFKTFFNSIHSQINKFFDAEEEEGDEEEDLDFPAEQQNDKNEHAEGDGQGEGEDEEFQTAQEEQMEDNVSADDQQATLQPNDNYADDEAPGKFVRAPGMAICSARMSDRYKKMKQINLAQNADRYNVNKMKLLITERCTIGDIHAEIAKKDCVAMDTECEGEPSKQLDAK